MPFAVQKLEPKYLSRQPLTTKLGDDHCEAVFNGTAANVIRQLSSLAAVAQRIFTDLNAQLKEVQNRTEKLNGKVANVDLIVAQLDAKLEPIPAGSLDEFSRLRTHFVSSDLVDKCLFTLETRPSFVQNVYETAIPSPVHLVKTIDPYRKDGQRSASLFLCMPFFKDVRVPYDVDIEMRRPTSLSSAQRGWKSEGEDDSLALDTTREDEEDRGHFADKSVDSVDVSDGSLDVTVLPTPNEKIYVNSLKFPPSDVVVDISGNNFRRMSSLRRSFIHQIEYLSGKKKKKKRRGTVAVEQLTSKDGQQLKVNEGASTSGETLKNQPKENKEVQTNFDEMKNKEKSNGFHRWFQRKPRSRNSIIGGIAVCEELDRVKKSKRRSIAGSLWIHSNSNNSSSSCSPSKSSTDSAVATATSSVSDTNIASLRSTGAVKMRNHGKNRGKREDGGQSSSGNWSASSSTRTSMESEDPIVTTAGIGENQLLLMTATATLPRCYGRNEKRRTISQSSSGKTSVVSGKSSSKDRNFENSSGYLSDGPYYRSSFARRSLPPRMANSATVTARWLRSLEEESGGNLCSETTDATSSTGTLTPRTHRRHRPLSPLVFDDGESSEFSVDTDGYYTSMHTDSGLRPMHSDMPHNASRLSDLREHGSNSTLSSVSSGRSSSSSSKKATTSSEGATSNKDSSDTALTPSEVANELTKKKVPPPPPPRVSTKISDHVVETSLDSSIGDEDRSRKVSSTSDSDAEVGERLQIKTKMNSARIPSLCVVTPSPSDDESTDKDAKMGQLQPENKFPDQLSDQTKSAAYYHSLPRNISDRDAFLRDQRAYRTLPRSFSRETQSEYKQNGSNVLLRSSPTEDNMNKAVIMPISLSSSSLNSHYSNNPSLRPGAHVTLDPTGKVIHVTGSLPRRFSQNNSAVNLSSQPLQSGQIATTPTHVYPTNSAAQPTVSRWSSVNPNSSDYGSNTFPRWRPNQANILSTQTSPTAVNNPPIFSTQADNAPRRWNNFGFLRRDQNQLIRTPIGAYVRLDGHPDHLEPGNLPKDGHRNINNQSADKISLKETASIEELAISANVPAPPAAMPLLQNTNYSQSSRIPTRSMPPLINSRNCNGLPPYYAPVDVRRSVITSSTTPTLAGRVSGSPNMMARGPVVDYNKPLSPINTSPNSPPIMATSSPILPKPSQPPISQLNTTSSGSTYSRPNILVPNTSNVSMRPPTGYNTPAQRQSNVQSPLYPTASTDRWSPSVRPLTINTYNQRNALPNNISTNHTPSSSQHKQLSPHQKPPSPLHTPPSPVSCLPPSQPLLNGSSTPNKMSMTTDELFAAIHQSKKKMNIKVESEASNSPAAATVVSSRSNSPCLKSAMTSSKPETGSLNMRPRTPPNDAKPGDRRSWAVGDSSSPATTPIDNRPAGDRRSWASDRLGPSKPTSLHDFKLLLLQAGRGNSPLSPNERTPSRKSAAEMLKTCSSPTKQQTNTSTLPNMSKSRLSPQTCGVSSTIPGRSASPKTLSNGHIPLSRSYNSHSLSRMRANCSVLHNRTDILSTPIPEDEGSEDEYENQQNISFSSNSSKDLFTSTPLMAAR